MGRGERTSHAVRSAQDLLFGPRQLKPINPLTGQAGQAQVEGIIERMEASGKFDEALALLVRFNDEQGNNNLKRLAEAMSEPILESSDEDFAHLCAVIDQEIDRDGKIPAFEALEATLEESIANRSFHHGLHQPTLDLLCRDHHLSESLRQSWAERAPIPMMFYGDGNKEQTHLNDQDSYKLRQAVYQQLTGNNRREALWAVRDSQNVLNDLQAFRPGTELIVDEIEEACRQRGGARVFASPFGSAEPDFNGGLDQDQLGQFLRAMPDQDRVKRLLTSYIESEYNGPHYYAMISDMQQALSEVGTRGDAAALSIDSHKRLDQTAKELIDNFAEETIAGRRDQAINSYKDVLAQELAASFNPADLSEQTRMFINWQSSANEDASKAWHRFQHNYLARSLLPDRKVEVSQEQWTRLLSESIRPNYGSPFSLSLSGYYLALGLNGIYRSRAGLGQAVDPFE